MFDEKDNDDRALLKEDVKTLARPENKYLLAARFEIQRNPDLQALFKEYRGAQEENAAEVLADQAATILAGIIDAPKETLLQATRYLADEYFQFGDQPLLIDAKTGRPLMVITEKDIWQPPPVAREGSKRLVKRGKEIRPEIRGFLIRWSFERTREQEIVKQLATRMKSSLVPQDKDLRLLPSTKDGRAVLADRLREDLSGILESVRGQAQQFLGHLRMTDNSEGQTFFGFTSIARVDLFLADHLSRNLKFDVLSAKKAEIGAQWVEEIARTVSRLAHVEKSPYPTHFPCFERQAGMLIANDAVYDAVAGEGNVFQVEGAQPLQVLGKPFGTLTVRSYDLNHRFLHDRWEIAAKLEYDLGLDFTQLEPLEFTELPQKVHQGEIVA